MMFGTAFYLLSMNRTEENALVDELTPFWLWPISVFQNQYELSLGEFKLDAFSDGRDSALCYILFVSATFLI